MNIVTTQSLPRPADALSQHHVRMRFQAHEVIIADKEQIDDKKARVSKGCTPGLLSGLVKFIDTIPDHT